MGGLQPYSLYGWAATASEDIWSKLQKFDYCSGYLFTYITALEGHCEITNPAMLSEA